MAGLREKGYTLLSPHAIDGMQGIVAESYKPLQSVARRKSFMGSLAISPALHGAVQEAAKTSIAQLDPYFGYPPRIASIELFHSVPQSSPYRSGQLWHLDIDQPKQMKWFVMCRPTMADNGPLTFLSASDSQRVQAATGYIPGQSLADDRVGDAHVLSLTGDAGVSAFLDTSRCLHFGSRVTTGERIALVVQFV